MSQSDAVIHVHGLVKRYGAIVAVDNITFDVPRGEVFGILGPNGAGKTTTLECIEGLQPLTTGRINVLGADVAKQTAAVKQRIGVQLQASSYFYYLSLIELLELFSRFYSRRVDAQALLRKVELEDKGRATVEKLSGGQRQRFTFAATLVNDPEIVFLDEPTTGLDPQARRHMWDLIRGIHNEGRTVVLTTHYMEEAQDLCHRVAIMDHGKVVALDTPETLILALPVPSEVRIRTDRPIDLAVLSKFDAVVDVHPGPDGLMLLGSTDAARTMSSLMTWAGAHGVSVAQLEVRPADLEDVFIALTGRQLRD